MTAIFFGLLIGLEIKHYVADYFLQPGWMLGGKGDFRKPGGYAHAGIHAALSFLVLLVCVLGAARRRPADAPADLRGDDLDRAQRPRAGIGPYFFFFAFASSGDCTSCARILSTRSRSSRRPAACCCRSTRYEVV